MKMLLTMTLVLSASLALAADMNDSKMDAGKPAEAKTSMVMTPECGWCTIHTAMAKVADGGPGAGEDAILPSGPEQQNRPAKGDRTRQ